MLKKRFFVPRGRKESLAAEALEEVATLKKERWEMHKKKNLTCPKGGRPAKVMKITEKRKNTMACSRAISTQREGRDLPQPK